MLIKLRLDELLGQEAFAFDVFDRNGQLMCKAGEPVSVRRLKHLSTHGLFRQQEKLPIEWIVRDEGFAPETAGATSALLDTPSAFEHQKWEIPYLLDRDEAMPFLDSMHAFWKSVEAGEQLDIALLKVTEHQLVGEVISRMDELQYLNQLRIRDGVTYSHTLDVTAVSIALGAQLGLSRKDLETLALGALLHDLGKLFIPKPIMFKSTRLNDKEFAVMQRHPEIGYRIIKEHLHLPEEVARPALEHQELYAGGGYPQKLYKDEIHFFSQIVKIADVYDALTSRRPYKEAICFYKAIKIMLLEGPRSFNPELLLAFLELARFPEDEIPPELKHY